MLVNIRAYSLYVAIIYKIIDSIPFEIKHIYGDNRLPNNFIESHQVNNDVSHCHWLLL